MLSNTRPVSGAEEAQAKAERSRPGQDMDISEPSGVAEKVEHGGKISDWERIDRLLMRRRITTTLLVSVLLLIIGGLSAGVYGIPPAIVVALATLIGGPIAIALGYYFNVTR